MQPNKMLGTGSRLKTTQTENILVNFDEMKIRNCYFDDDIFFAVPNSHPFPFPMKMSIVHFGLCSSNEFEIQTTQNIQIKRNNFSIHAVAFTKNEDEAV